jgi:sulfite reductase (NADPH) flavoprotein alpha-component
VHFKPGDSLGIYAQNDPTLVNHLIDALGKTGEEIITEPRSKEEMTLRHFLTHKANLARLTSNMLNLVYESETDHDRKNKLHHLLDKDNLRLYLSTHDPLDLFKEFRGVEVPLQDLCARFGPLLPRFYSVASSLLTQPANVDLTVALFTYSHSGEKRYGVASHFLCHLANENTPIPLYVQAAHKFALPANKDADIIMIGPGTGIAPYRAFMQERVHHGSKGKSWLFFGERNSAYDFFYEDYWRSLIEQNLLVLTTAFSRDQENKVYVQDRMLENAKDLYRWIQDGAYFYVCGDAQDMAKDVDRALHHIIRTEGALSEEAAKEQVKALKKEGRYLLDVY